jgi:hypothetical protein
LRRWSSAGTANRLYVMDCGHNAATDQSFQKKAQLWINHDKPQSQAQKRSPQFGD